jgi:nicotinate phosphoribosyltransferase
MANGVATLRPAEPVADINDHGLLSPAETSLLTDQYELTMAASYLARGMNELATFELFVRHLPPHRDWLLVAGIGPALRLVETMRFGSRELDSLEALRFPPTLLEYLAGFRFSGDVEAMPEGTVAFAGEPLLRVTAPRIEAQLVETLLLNQINFQTAIATKAARLVLAAGAGTPGAGGSVVDFSPRRDHGTDAAMKAARAAVIAGATGTSNVAAAARYGLVPVGTMAHSYVMSFPSELDAFRAFMVDTPDNAVLLVDTYETLDGVANAITAARVTGVHLKGIRLDSGDRLELARAARAMLDEAGLQGAQIVASGDLDEQEICGLVAAGAPIDVWGVGTDLGTSRDSPTVGGVYKLVADRAGGRWRPVAKRSAAKATLPGPKQVFRCYRDGVIDHDVLATASESLTGHPLLEPALREGRMVLTESLGELRARAADGLRSLPAVLRRPGPGRPDPYSVVLSPGLAELTAAVRGEASAGELGAPIEQRGAT